MNILAVDDNKIALEMLVYEIGNAMPGHTVESFTSPGKALDYVEHGCRELKLAFLDVEMPGMNGIELAAKIKMVFPRAVIMFITAFPQYTFDAYKVHASGYLMKPVTGEQLKAELDALPQPFIYTPISRIRAQTFGNFELFADEKPLKFARAKSKELLAYLIDRRGASCTMNELVAVLFPEEGDGKKQQRDLRVMIADLKKSLSAVNAESILYKEHNSIAVDVSRFDCDYYRLLDGDPSAANLFNGEYMTNYSWSEFVVGNLLQRVEK